VYVLTTGPAAILLLIAKETSYGITTP
jgi:hypothetical protein